LFRATRDRIAAGGVSEEDERSADWIHLLRTRPADVLVVGCGRGAVACALAAAGTRVTAVDPSEERLSFLRIRAEQSGHEIRGALASEPWAPPAAGPFDLVAYLDPAWPGGVDPARTARDAAGLLRSTGQVAWRASRIRGASLRHLMSALRREGFTDIRAYAPLPERGVPVFHVPLGAGSAMREFLTGILPLVSTAPSATRRRYGLAARLAGVAPSAARVPGIAGIAELLVPGWLVLATYAGAPRAR
jgi:SAM-dependent methyltransferase